MASLPASFHAIGLKPWLVKTCDQLGIRQPTPVQQNCIRPILQGKDVMAGAPTGSGKTAAFALPIINLLSDDPYGVFALVLTPTRELAFQISEQFTALGTELSLKQAVVVGGKDMMHQAIELQQRPHIVIGTPGRIVDHLRSSSDTLKLNKLRILVLDEADRLLDLGFSEELKAILSFIPASRQTLLFSATMTRSLQALQSMAMHDPFIYNGCPENHTVESLVQEYVFVPLAVKELYLTHLLQSTFKQKTIIVFVNTCKKCEMLYHMLWKVGVVTAALHARQSMRRRLAALGKFRASKVRVLLATDVASRGLDIPEVDVVINYDTPSLTSDYIHRTGRTARAGRRGQCVSVVTQYDIELFLAIEKSIGKKIAELTLDEEEVLKLLNKVNTAKRFAKMALAQFGFEDRQPSEKRKHEDQDVDEKAAGSEGGDSHVEKQDDDKSGSTKNPPKKRRQQKANRAEQAS